MLFLLFIFIVILQRLIEVLIAKRNEQKIRLKGGFEVGASHYPYMIALHVSFFLCLITEVLLFSKEISSLFLWLFLLFLMTQLLRIWCLASLGPFWNTKIMILPGANVVRKGPYQFMKHPNYLVVTIEILLLPLMFQAYFTAIIFSILNLIMLSVRISVEEKALMELTNYPTVFKKDIATPIKPSKK